MKLSAKQKEVVVKMRKGQSLFENVITPGAKWCLGKKIFKHWGNVHGSVVSPLVKSDLLHSHWYNAAVRQYSLTETGKSIEL